MDLRILLDLDLKPYQENIPKGNIFISKQKKGLVKEAHLTLFSNIDNFKSLVDTIYEFGQFEIILSKISSFRVPHKNFDVLYLKPKENEKLMELKEKLNTLIDYSPEFPFTPHITLSYIKKNSCKELEGSIEPIKIKITQIQLRTSENSLIYKLKNKINSDIL